MAVTFQYRVPEYKLKDAGALKKWIADTIKREGFLLGDINYVFASDEEVLQMNIQYLDHHTYTDIITFDSCEGDRLNGDIIISIDRVGENAFKFGTSFEKELRRVMIHGVLHLCGYKDKSKKDSVMMRKKEDESLKYWRA